MLSDTGPWMGKTGTGFTGYINSGYTNNHRDILMNKEEKFLAYLEALKTDKNSGLLEGVINGFKTLVEYRVDGNISERQIDIMENSEDIEDMAAFDDSEMEDSGDMDVLDEAVEPRGYTVADVEKMTWEEILNWNGMTVADFDARVKDWHPVEVSEDIAYWVDQVEKQADDFDEVYGGKIEDQDVPLDESTSDVKAKIFGKNSDAARHAKFVEDQKKGVAKGIAAAGAKNRAAFAALNEEEGGTSEEANAVSDEEPIMEVGEGEVKGKLNPALLRQIDDAIEKDIQKMSVMIDRQKLVNSPEEKTRYLNNMRGQKWRDELISIGVEPSTMKGLIPALAESMDDANAALLECVNIMKMVLDK